MKTGDYFSTVSAALYGMLFLCSVLAACGVSSNDGQAPGSGPVGAAATGGQGSVGGAGGGAIAPGGQGGAGSSWTAPVAGQPAAGSSGTTPVGGQPAAGSGGSEQTDACVPYTVEVPPPDCAGMSGYELTVCYQIAHGELPATCQGLCGEDKEQCCAQIYEAQLDIANYPECEQGLLCPDAVLDQLKNNPYGNSISEECGTCICESCNEQINFVNTHGQSAITLLQCGLGNLVTRDCFVCNPPPCDIQLGTNLMTGPCSGEVMAACPSCICAGMFDLNCMSLAACLDEKIAFDRPCAAAHATVECIMASCPSCPPLTPCPSNLMQ
jgi:hypothetical protein